MRKTAVVTGASRGLGEVISDFLAGASYDLVLTARGPDALAEVAVRARRKGARVTALSGDVADAAHRRRLAGAARELGGLDLLVNNASDLGPTPLPALAGYPLDALERVYRVNVIAPIGLTQDVLPMLRERRGRIVNITSDAAVNAYAGWGGYGSSKAALELASRVLAEELRDDGVSVVVVDPGDIRTAMHQSAFPGEDISDRPLPDVTVPFWAWLLGSDRAATSGSRYEAQGERWEVAS